MTRVIVKWNTFNGNHYEGELIDTDDETGIVKLKDGTQMAMNLENLILDDGRVVIDNQTTFLEEV
jgi:hypothetical protein